ncbi:Protein of unknown function [Singulisphaera sp. GP187]|uniref:DUF3592 domain-containing protein n=1 Tax=Singulisphaera sp. GP187 TaxID=1882752 RepID=UPI00092CBEBE|nr:DUF3592 domain-containing protein [Singulisphaera sp. GP187]SIO65165.1 Protein of unknown function [Singulisphaera sp. GP187]
MNTWFEQTKFRLQLCGLIMMFMCPGFLIVFAGQTKQQIESNRWPSVEGTIDGAFPKETLTAKRTTRYAGRVAYHYTVGGQRYSSDLTDLGPGTWHDTQVEALKDVNQYEPGMTVPVFYDPHDPKIGVLQKGMPRVHLVLLVLLSLLTVVSTIASFFTIRSWIRSFRRGKNAASTSGSDASGSPPAQVSEHNEQTGIIGESQIRI